jgi:hypothetical protein
MALIAKIETSFEVMLDVSVIIEFSSYPAEVEMLAKYRIEVSWVCFRADSIR